ncbi:alpha-glucosidase C-terminal domain-containing protein, partial [Bacteroidota bacterium]
LKYWVKACNIDGYRCDVAAMVPTEFWNYVRSELEKLKPVFLLAEASEPELHESAFDMTYNWQLKDIMNRMGEGDNNVLDLIKHFEIEKEEYPPDAFRMTFTTNHDENSWNGTVFDRLGKGVEAFAVLTGTVPGMMLIYSGQEAGLDKPLKFFEKDRIEWKDHKLTEIYSKLLELKRDNKALWNGSKGGEIKTLSNNKSNSVLAFVREKDENQVVSVFNFSPEMNSVNINNKGLEYSYTELFTGVKFDLKVDTEFELEPWSYLVLYK